MSTAEVADQLVDYCREGKNLDAINELYSDDIVSRELRGTPHELVEGKEAVIAKNQHWFESVEEIHGVEIGEPIVTGNFFAVAMDMDVTYKNAGSMTMNEIAVYEVKDGQIVSEQFFYSM